MNHILQISSHREKAAQTNDHKRVRLKIRIIKAIFGIVVRIFAKS